MPKKFVSDLCESSPEFKKFYDKVMNGNDEPVFPDGGKEGDFLVSDGKGGGKWLQVGIAEEGEF